MKIRALAVAAVLCSCGQQVPTYSTSSGSLALSNDDALLYAIDSDSNQVFVLDARSDEVKAAVQVGRQPEKVVVGRDDTLYVSNRMGRSVSIIKRGEWSEARRLDTAVEPCGMAIDGDTLYVVNATALDDSQVGTLQAFDLRTLSLQWETKVGHEPRAVAVTGGRALVSLFKDGDVATVDLSTHQVVRPKTALFENLNRGALENRSGAGGGPVNEPPPDSFGGTGGGNSGPNSVFFGQPKLFPRGLETLTVSPDGRQVYASSLLSSDQVLPSTATVAGGNGDVSASGGDGYSGGTCGAGSVTSPSILTFDGTGDSLATDVGGCGGQSTEGVPAQVLTSGNPAMPIQGPSASVVDPTGAFLFVVGKDSNNVAILQTNSAAQRQDQGDTLMRAGAGFDAPTKVGFAGSGFGSVHTTVSVGAGPTGIAVSRDGKTAWVLNAFDHTVSRLERKDGVVQEVRATQFTGETLPPDVVAGRKLFFSAVDSRMTSQTTGISCASCHLEGREDGHVWNFTDGPRQTPSLAGRMLSKTAPFHWNGEFDGLTQFMAQTVNHRMGGFGVTPAMENQIKAFIEFQPLPDNPHKGDVLTAAQQRGLIVFNKAQCNSCHRGEAFTDNSFVDVGTYVTHKLDAHGFVTDPEKVVDDPARFIRGGLNTPSLIGISRTAPYLHDGSALTLRERVMMNKDLDLHGKTSQLTTAEIDDLVEYLKTF